MLHDWMEFLGNYLFQELNLNHILPALEYIFVEGI